MKWTTYFSCVGFSFFLAFLFSVCAFFFSFSEWNTNSGIDIHGVFVDFFLSFSFWNKFITVGRSSNNAWMKENRFRFQLWLYVRSLLCEIEKKTPHLTSSSSSMFRVLCFSFFFFFLFAHLHRGKTGWEMNKMFLFFFILIIYSNSISTGPCYFSPRRVLPFAQTQHGKECFNQFEFNFLFLNKKAETMRKVDYVIHRCGEEEVEEEEENLFFFGS